MVDPVMQCPPLESVMHVAGAVRGDDDNWRRCGCEGAEFGNRDREIRQSLEEKRLELVVGAVDLIDEQDGWHLPPVIDRLQQGTPHEESLGK